MRRDKIKENKGKDEKCIKIEGSEEGNGWRKVGESVNIIKKNKKNKKGKC